MADRLEAVRKLKERISKLLEAEGLILDEDDFSISLKDGVDVASFKLNVLPGALMTDADLDEEKYNSVFKEIVGDW